MIRGILLAMAAVWGLRAFAVVVPQSFTWERSGRFFLSMTYDGNPVDLRGNVRLGESVDVRQGAIAAQVKSYAPASPVISIIVSSDANDVASVILVQADGDGDTKKLITNVGIPDRKATAARDLEFILSGLKSRKQWDALASFNWIASANGGKQLFQVADKVEVASDADLSVTKPQPRGSAAGQGQTVRTPQLPRDARGMDPRTLDNGGYPPPPPQYGRNGEPLNITPDGQVAQQPAPDQQQPRYTRRYRSNPYGDTAQYDNGMYPLPPPDYQGGYPQQRNQPRYPQQQRQYGGAGYGGYNNGGGYPPPPPMGGGGFFQNLFGN